MIALAKAKGTPGDTGKDGLDGMRGADGINGMNGIDGLRGADGLHGAKGLDGSKGEIGAVGPQGDKGEAGMIWRGTYRSDIEYWIGDVVGVSGSAYVCVAATNQAPPVGFGWELLVSRGAQGIRGIKGEDGGGGAADAGTLTGATLAANVVNSSLTKVGTLGKLTVTATIVGSITGNAETATSATSATTATTAGTVTTAAQPAITSVGTLTGLTVSATIAGSINGNAATATSATTAGTVTTAAQPSITSVGTLTSLTTSGVITGTNTTASTSSATGAVIIAGGVGIAKDSFINGHRIGQGLLASQNNLAVGTDALNSTITGGIDNVAVGYFAGKNITTGVNNVMLGSYAGQLNTTGQSNMCIGSGAHYSNTTGSYNLAIGTGAGQLQDNGSVYNSYLGTFAGYGMTSGDATTCIGGLAGRYQANGSTDLGASSNSVYIGYNAKGFNNSDSNTIVIGSNAIGLGANTTVIGTSSTTATTVYGALSVPSTTASTSSATGALIVSGGAGIAKDSFVNSQRIGVGLLQDTTNLAVGVNALSATTAGGINNTAIGSGCGQAITGGSQNTFLGYAVGTQTTTGAGNCSIGYASLNQNTVGNYNTAMGYGALQNTTASNNTAVGIAALGNITTGSLNVGIGREAGCFQADGTTALTTANNSVYLGRDTRGTQSDSNSIVIGYQAIGLGANTTVIGTSSTTETKLFGQLTLDATACISASSATALALKTVVPAGTGVTPTIQIICPSSSFALQNVTTAQEVFSTPLDTISLQAATTYMVEGQYILQTGTTTHTTSMSFVSSPVVTAPAFVYRTIGWAQSSANATTNTQQSNFFEAIAGGIVTNTSTLARTVITFSGILRITDTGTLVPKITFSAAPGAAANFTLVGSYIKFYPIGANTIDSVGTAIS